MKKVSNSVSSDKSPIRVLQIGMHDQVGGIENFIMNYYRKIDKRSIQFDFLIPYVNGGYYDNEIRKLGGNIFYFSFKDDKNILKFISELNDFFKNNKYDIIHCSDSGLGILYLYFAKKNNIPIRIAHSHATNVESGLKGIIKTILSKFYVKLANNYFACSTEAGNYMFKGENFKIISNSIDYLKFKYNYDFRIEIRKKYKVLDNEILIGNIGRMCEQKNQKFLLDILRKLPLNYKLMIIGEGPLKETIEKEIEQKNLKDRVILIKPKIDIYKYYNAFDFFCLPSLYEGLPIVGIEAQANGLKCLLSNEISRECSFTKNIVFCDNKDVDEWVNELKYPCERTIKIADKYDITKNTEKLEELYLNFLKEL